MFFKIIQSKPKTNEYTEKNSKKSFATYFSTKKIHGLSVYCGPCDKSPLKLCPYLDRDFVKGFPNLHAGDVNRTSQPSQR